MIAFKKEWYFLFVTKNTFFVAKRGHPEITFVEGGGGGGWGNLTAKKISHFLTRGVKNPILTNAIPGWPLTCKVVV